MMLLRKHNLKTSVAQTVLWKKLYILKLESRNTRHLDQKLTLVCAL